jgi:amidase
MAGIRKVLDLLGLDGEAVTAVSHGTTVATNQLLEGRVGELGLITNEGYEFLLEIARQSVPDGYGNSYFWVKPDRIVPVDRVRTVGGRMAFDGSQIRPFDEAQAAVLESQGATVTDAYPVLHSADAAFRTLRAWVFHHRFRTLLDKRPGDFKASLRDNIMAGADLTGEDVARAYQQLTSVHDRMRAFFTDHDLLALPVSQVPPFSAEEEYPATINGEPQQTYLDWMRSAYLITVTGCPAISVPAGFTAEGWPVGLQLVGPHRSERRLLEIAHAFERATRVGERRPSLRSVP